MSKRDYYAVLGVSRTASADEIRRAYRKLARQLHPDVNKAPDAQARFTEVQEAYDTLNDAGKRKVYDQFGHAAPGTGSGRENPHYTWSNVGGGRAGAPPDVDMEDIGSMFDAFFGGRAGMGGMGGTFNGPRGAKSGAGRKGRNHRAPESSGIEAELPISFMTGVLGGTERVRLAQEGRTRTIEVKVPKGIEEGAKLRVRGGGGGEDGADVILTVRIGQHPLFRRGDPEHPGRGLDLYLELPVNVSEATLGANVVIPTLDGAIEMTIPPGTASGRKLRVRGRGIEDSAGKRGDLYAVIRIVPPDGRELAPDERALLTALAGRFASPRSGPEWPSGTAAGGRA